MDLRNNDTETLSQLISGLRNQKNWVAEVNDVILVASKLHSLGKSTSVRDLASIMSKSKSWIAVTFILAKGLKLYPEIEKFSNRNKAYVYVKRKQKLRRFLEL